MSGVFFQYLRLLRPYAAYSLGVFFLMSIVLLLIFLEPVFLLVFINEAVLKTNLNLLLILAGAMVACAATAHYLYGIVKCHGYRIGQLVVADLRRKLFDHILEQPPPFFEKHPPSELLEVFVNEVDGLDAVREAIFWGSATVVGLVVIFGFCLAIDPPMAPIVLAPLPCMLFIMALDSRMRTRQKHALESQTRLVGFLGQRLSNVLTIQAFGREDDDARRLSIRTSELLEAKTATEVLSQVQKRSFSFIRSFVLAAVLLVGGTRVIRSAEMTLGALFGIFMFTDIFFQQCIDLFGYLVRSRLASVSWQRVSALLKLKSPIEKASRGVLLRRVDGRIELDDVHFRYGPELPWVLTGVSCQIEPGEYVAIVGKSGSGKSTLFRLLLRFYDPTAGAIRIDGHDLRGVQLGSLRRQYGLLTQKPVIFDGSIEENIRYARPEAGLEDVISAARNAVAQPFIERLPLGYNSRLTAEETELSGGEQHRLALARVVLKDAPILLLDEVMAGLDARTEKELQAAIDSARGERTTVVIAHRLSTILDADKIVVMDGGQVAEVGTHDILYQKRGIYYRLFNDQFRQAFAKLSTRILRPFIVVKDGPGREFEDLPVESESAEDSRPSTETIPIPKDFARMLRDEMEHARKRGGRLSLRLPEDLSQGLGS